MARRRKTKEAPIKMLFKAPWWISIAIGVVVFVVLKAIVPSAFASNIILKPLGGALSGLAWIISGLFFLVGLLSLAREKFSASKSAAATWNPREPGSKDGGLSATSGWQSKVEKYAAQNHPEYGKGRVREAWESSIAGTTPSEKQKSWRIELLRSLEWKRFEDVCQKFYELKGIRSETTPLGPDGGIDIRLYQDESGKATSIAQCKAWGKRLVGVQPVRELLGVMTHEKIEKAFFMASGNFSDEAKTFAQSNPITLINGEMLVAMIKRLPELEQQALLAFATDGDYTTPTCPSCGIKMRHITGAGTRPDFWGCHNYPRCLQKLGMRAAVA
jgi:restriction system protein